MHRQHPRLWARLRRSDRGAAAVEFALLLPVLIVIVLGTMEFGRVYNIQLGLTAAAREGVRVMALDNNVADARAVTRSAGPGVAILDSDLTICTQPAGGTTVCTTSPANPSVAKCTPGATATVTVSYQVVFFTSFIAAGAGPKLTGKGVMRCNG